MDLQKLDGGLLYLIEHYPNGTQKGKNCILTPLAQGTYHKFLLL
jgi:hypothetical protein